MHTVWRGCVFVSALTVGCTGEPSPTTCSPDEARWNSEIQQIVETQCGTCHGEPRNFGAPVTLLDYGAITRGTPGARMVDRMREHVVSGYMPPAQLPRIPQAQLDALVDWASCGAEEAPAHSGLSASAPVFIAPEEGPAGLQTLDLTAANFEVVAEVDPDDHDHYECFVFDASIATAQFIRRFEVLLDQTQVLHHLVLLRDTERRAPDEHYPCMESMPEGSQYLYAWAPGQSAVEFPENSGLRITPGERYVMQIHYHNSTGTTVNDSSGVRLYLAESAATEYGMIAVGPLGFSIGPNQTHTESSSCMINEPMTVLAGMPHMHEYGQSFSQSLTRANGTTESIIELSGWSFDAQLFYRLPFELSPGDRLTTACTWNNPNGTSVRSGTRTEDEMCFNFMYVTPPPTDRYCDDGEDGPPTNVSYTPGSCAPTDATADLPLVRGDWALGSAPEFTGGAVPDGHWVLSENHLVVSSVTTPIGQIDLEDSFMLARGQLWTEGQSITRDLSTIVHIQSEEGPSFGRPNVVSSSGTWSPGVSPVTANYSCPTAATQEFRYQVDGQRLTVAVLSRDIPSVELWIHFVYLREL